MSDSDWYSRQISRIPLLSADEEILLGNLVQELMQHPDGPEGAPKSLQRRGKRAKDRMIQANLRLVVTVANKYSRIVPSSDFMDLVQAGNLGLARAVELFDPARGYKFSTYSYWWIRQGISRAIENQSRLIRLPSSITQEINRIASTARKLTAELHRTPSKTELADALGTTVQAMDQLMQWGNQCSSLDAHAKGDSGQSTIGELISDPSSGSAEEMLNDLANSDRIAELMQCLDKLEPMQRQMIEGTIGLSGAKRYICEVGRELGLSAAQSSKILREAKVRLRMLMAPKPLRGGEPPPLPRPSAYQEQVDQLALDEWLGSLAMRRIEQQPQPRQRRARRSADIVQPSIW
jgi:RNA polymerase primary sigma factor